MRRVIAGAICSIVFLLSATSPISALVPSDPACVRDPFKKPNEDDEGLCSAIEDGQSDRSMGTRSGTTGRWPPEGWIIYPFVKTAPDGTTCVTYDWGPPLSDPSADGGNPFDPSVLIPRTENPLPECPLPEGGAQAQDPAVIAAQYWERIPLPRPSPYIAPGWAITGKLAYLETNGELHHIYTNSTPVGPLEILATGAYYVDWGDGESTGPHTREGKPWPDGEITHDYVWAKKYNIVVTERWTATWSLGDRTGVLRELRTTGRIDDFPARQIQAVIRS